MAEITGRVLPPEEWSRLTDPEMPGGEQLQDLPATHAVVAVVEVNGRIDARWAAINVVHLEGLAVRAGAGAGVARALLDVMTQELVTHGVKEVLTQSERDEVAAMIEAIGGRRVPGQTWVIPIA